MSSSAESIIKELDPDFQKCFWCNEIFHISTLAAVQMASPKGKHMAYSCNTIKCMRESSINMNTEEEELSCCDECREEFVAEDGYILDHQGYTECLCPECGETNKNAITHKEFFGT